MAPVAQQQAMRRPLSRSCSGVQARQHQPRRSGNCRYVYKHVVRAVSVEDAPVAISTKPERASPSQLQPRQAAKDAHNKDAHHSAVKALQHTQQQQAAQEQLTSASDASSSGGLAGWWAGMEPKDKLVFAATLALTLSNMGKVDMSVAIVPMSAEAGWSASVSGLVQALFYTGYMLACIPGGYTASRAGGRLALPVALATWSAATFVAPLAAATVPTLSLTRFVVGAGQGVAPSAVVDVVARDGAALAARLRHHHLLRGLHLGTVVGLLAAPPIVNTLGWQALFYIYGGLGLVWYAWFEGMVMPQLEKEAPEMTAGLTGLAGSASTAGQPAPAVPYKAFLGAKEVQALMLTHFCNNMYYFTLLSWLPTYFVQDLGMDLSQASLMSMVPAVTGFVVSNIAGRFADGLLAGGMPLPRVRKTVQTISMLGSAVSMLGALVLDSPAPVVGLMVLGLTLHPFTLAGLFCTPNDLSTKYAGAILGISNTCGALGAVFGIALCGVLLDATGSWEASLYAPLIGLLVLGNYFYVFHCNNEPIDFDARAAAAAEAEAGSTGASSKLN